MTDSRARRCALAIATLLALAACSSPPAQVTSNAASAVASPFTLAPTAIPTAVPTASPAPIQTPAPTTSPTGSGRPPGGFSFAPNEEADALFADLDDCENRRDGYRLQFPEEWWTNTEIGAFPPCVWFSPTFYEVPDEKVVPHEIAITIEYTASDTGSFEDALRREFVTVGGQNAVRVEYASGTYRYQVQLGPTPEEGPNLVIQTTTEMGGDYELNKAVLDRIVATIEFIGSVQ